MRVLHNYTLLISLALVLLAGHSFAQNDKKDARKAERYFINASFDHAAELYSGLAQKHPENFEYNMKAGISWFYALDAANKLKAIPFLEAAGKAMGQDTIPELYYYLGQTYHLADRFDDAIASYGMLRHFIETLSGDTVDLNEIRHYIEMCRSAKELVNAPVNMQVQNLGPNVNSPGMDYAPTLPADGSMLIFTSRREGTTGGKKDDDGWFYEDIYSSKKNGEGWDAAQNAGTNLNTKKHDASVALSPDGKLLYLYRASDVWVSNLENGIWGKPKKLLPDVNSKSFEPSITLSADGQTIFFVSERKGGFGGKDIYMSTKNADGSWSTAKNLGSTINTAFDEDSPFLTADGKTLFFSSQGHNSMGGYDVFSSILENESWGQPHNLGYPINTSWDEIFYVQGNAGNSYYATIRTDTHGDLDIYRIFAKKKKKVRLLLITKNNASTAPAPSRIKLTSDSSSYESALVMGVEEFDSLVPGRLYTLEVTMEGYRSKRISFVLPGQEEDEEFYQEVFFEPLKDASGAVAGQRTTFYNAFFDIEEEAEKAGMKGQNNTDTYSAYVRNIDTATTTLNFKIYTFIDKDTGPLASGKDTSASNATVQGWNGIRDSTRFAPALFEYHKAELSDEAIAQLMPLYEYLAANKNVKVELHGYSDSKSSASYNLMLSKKRADAVAAWLKSKGIAALRIKTAGHGESSPVAPNENPDGSDNPEGRQKNRRVQFILVMPAK